MTAPQIIERALTFRFAQSVSIAGTPVILQISLTPLNDSSSPTAGATFAGGVRSASIALSDPTNYVTFNLIPTYAAGLISPITYRVMWRAGVTARTFTQDFAMPDADLDFDQLASLNDIIDGQTYIQQTDLGIAGRVARLNNAGIPETSAGDPVAQLSDVTQVTNDVNAEVVARLAADVAIRTDLEGEISAQVDSTLNTSQVYSNNLIIGVNGDISTERSSRINSDASLQAQITANLSTLTSSLNSVAASSGGNTTALSHKADLDNTGHVPVAQIPDAILTNAFPVADQASMLALSTSTVHKGSLAVRPDGVFLLTTNDPTQLVNWVSLSTVSSVNGKRGAAVLSAMDVGAIPTGGSITISQVTGLATQLGTLALTSSVTGLATTVAGILGDPTLVHTTSGVIPSTLLDSSVVYINSVGQLVKKDGTIIPITGGQGAVFSVNTKTGLVVLSASDVGAIATGASIPQTQITGLSTSLGLKADATTVTTLSSSLTTGLAAKADLVSGLVPLAQVPVVPLSGVTGLATLIANNQLTTSSNAVNRIATLEGQIAGGGGGGGGGGVSSTVPFYTSSNVSTVVTNFSNVNLHSPWGVDSDGTLTGTVGTWYYLYTGVRSTDVAYPYISPQGHLNLRKWNESGPADPVYALDSTVTALSATVSAKANQTDLTALTNTVATKANQTALTTLSTTVDGKASQADLNAANTAIANKANQTDLTNLTTVVGTKAAQTDLAALTTSVGAKANQTDLTAAVAVGTANTSALAAKADLSAGVLATGQIPNVPQNKVTGLSTTLAAKADLDGSSKILVAQLPSIPQSAVTGLGTTLGAKADLVAGYVPLSQIPTSALPNVVVVANRAAMLALSTVQVQYGDLVLINSTDADKGTWVLTGNDPSQFSNWTELTTPNAPVTSVNGQVGDAVLTAAQVGALASNAVIPQTQVTGLTSALASFATTTALTSGLSGKMAPADVQAMFYLSSMVKRADYVSTSPIASLAGQQSVDGVIVPVGAIVLTTAQSSSVNNGLWTVNNGSWTRPPDFATGSFLARDSIVIVANATVSANGTNNPYTIWQETNANGFIDTSSNNWTRIAYAAPPFTPSGGNGITVTGSSFAVNPVTGGGILTGTSGVSVDPNVVARKFVGTVPGGSTTAGVTHNLNTYRPQVSIWDTASNTLQLAGVTATSANAISIEFANAPATGQYAVAVVG